MKPGLLRLSAAALLLLVQSGTAIAQYGDPRFSYGIFLGAAAKFGIVQQPRMRYLPWGAINAGMYAAIGGTEPGSMTARLHAQFLRDDIYCKVGPGEAYIMESIGLVLNPEVSIPIRNRLGEYKLEFIAGIGASYTIGQSLGMHNVNGYFGGNYLDNLADTIFSARRSLVPFVTAGFAFRVHRRSSLILRIGQDVQNVFYAANTVTLYSSTEARAVNLSSQATRLLIGCQIRLGKLPEMY